MRQGHALETLDVSTGSEWRSWLRRNHLSEEGVWLVFHRAGSGEPSISYDDALDEALAYGWIDSIIRKLDTWRYARKFTPRRIGSVWSKTNIDRVYRLTREGKMTRWGLVAFEKRSLEASLAEKFQAVGAPAPLASRRRCRRTSRHGQTINGWLLVTAGGTSFGFQARRSLKQDGSASLKWSRLSQIT